MEMHRMYVTVAIIAMIFFYNLLIYDTSESVDRNIAKQTKQQSFLYIDNVSKMSVNDSKQNNSLENLTINDIFISVRTTRYHQFSRLPLILRTWFQLAKEQVWFFTDTSPSRLHQFQTNGHIVYTNCPPTHRIKDLCCKTNAAFDHYIKSGKKWWCRFDDDNYVNIPRLVIFLQQYDYGMDWYFGRATRNNTRKPEEELTEDNVYFATGGAGYCISKNLALRMLPIAINGRFVANCLHFGLTEDLAMAFLLEKKLNVKLTFTPEFHSHLEKLWSINSETFKNQISFGFSKIGNNWTVINVSGFHGKYDPTRYGLSQIHPVDFYSNKQVDGHMINTNCATSHNIQDLCCKTNVGYDRFMESGKKWWCRFDDDNYVNIPRLVDMLQKFDHTKDWYLGKPIRAPGEPIVYFKHKVYYATGGAGYCISKALGLKMLPFYSNGKFVDNCVKLCYPEDITMGYLLDHMLNVKMTYVPHLHSHLELLTLLKPETYKDQISFSYSKHLSFWNVLRVPGFYGRYDPTRILSLHCLLFPHFKFCPR